TVAGVLAPPSPAQAVRSQPYNAQLRTDPAVGNVQGIQRYGRSLKTDPDEGEGFSYHVYPVAENPAPLLLAGSSEGGAQPQFRPSTQAAVDAEKAFLATNARINEKLKAIFDNLTDMQRKALMPHFDGEATLLKFQQRAKNDIEFVQTFLK